MYSEIIFRGKAVTENDMNYYDFWLVIVVYIFLKNK